MKKLLYIIVLFLAGQSLFASHYMGGEITWRCLPNGNFRFILVVYRECAGISYPNSVMLESNSPAGNIAMNLYPNASAAKVDISPDCNNDPSLPHIDCASTPFGSQYANAGAIEKWTYTSDASHPNGVQLLGIPPASGWYFAYNSCCRNPCTNIPNSSAISWFLRAMMYPYNNQNTYPCYDDSPQFTKDPQTVICTGYPYSFQQYASDPQLDSLSFDWGRPLDDNIWNAITNYNPGYSYNSPLPGTFHNPNNINATMDPLTGEVNYTSYNQGAFVMVTKVTSYNQGVKTAEVFREMQFVLLSCGANMPPEVNITKTATGNPVPQVSPGTFVDTVYVGSTAEFEIEGVDTIPVFLSNGDLTTVSVDALSPHFGQGFTNDSNGCLIQPCATLDPAPPNSNVLGMLNNFSWEVTQDHFMINANTAFEAYHNPPYYDFDFMYQDDFCPAPGLVNAKLRLYIQDTSIRNFRINESYCIKVLNQNDVSINWRKVTDPDSVFRYYKLFKQQSPTASFVPIFSSSNPSDTTFFDPGAAGAYDYPKYKLIVGYGYNNNVYEEEAFNGGITYLNSPSSACLTQAFSVNLFSGGQSIDSLYWDFDWASVNSGSGTGPYTLQADSTGILNLVVYIDNECGLYHFDQIIEVHPIPEAKITGDRFFCYDGMVQLSASGGDLYYWSTGHTTPDIDLYDVTYPRTIEVRVTDSTTQCSVIESFVIRKMEPYQASDICVVGAGQPDDTQNIITLTNDPLENIKSYKIYYKTNPLGVWEELGEFPKDNRIILDEINDPSRMQYYYTVQAIDSCDVGSGFAERKAPPFLVGQLVNDEVRLNWQPYHGGASGETNLYKQKNPHRDFEVILTQADMQTSFTEKVHPDAYASYVIGTGPFDCGSAGPARFSFSNTFTLNDVGLDEGEDPDCSLQILTDGNTSTANITWHGGEAYKSTLMIYDLLGREHCSFGVGRATREVYNLGVLPRGILIYSIYNNDNVFLEGKLLR